MTWNGLNRKIVTCQRCPRLLDTFNVYFFMHTTQPPGTPEQPHRKVLVAQHFCWR